MSLLANESYANPSTPLWLSAGGGAVPSLTVTGTLTAGDVNVNNGQLFPNQAVLQFGAGLPYGMEISSPSGIDGQINTDAGIYFGRKGTNGGSTSITPGIAPNTDVVTVGGTLSTQKLLAGAGMAGTGSIPIGQTNVTIAASQVTASSLIFFSRTGTSGGPGAGPAQGTISYRPADIVTGVSFKAYLVDSSGIGIAASNTSADFVWMIVN